MNALINIEGFLKFLGDAVLMVNDDSEIVFANTPCLDLFKYSEFEFNKLTIDNLINKKFRHNHKEKVNTYIHTKADPKVMMTRGVMPCIDSQGQEFFARISIANIEIDGLRYGIATIHDYSTIQNTMKSLENAANKDKLTDLFNKRYLETIIEDNNLPMWLSNAVGVLYFDLNRFKVINDRYGHHIGDSVLSILSGRLKNTLRTSDLIFRVGGDEFLVLFSISNTEKIKFELENIANKINQTISEPMFISQINKTLSVGVSIGIGSYPYDNNDMLSLITLADEAMYKAKKNKVLYSFVQA